MSALRAEMITETLDGSSDLFAASTSRDLELRDPVPSRRDEFLIPRATSAGSAPGEEVAYFVGNSLGCQPRAAADAVVQELEDWALLGVEGHWHARRPWIDFQQPLREASGRLVGCAPSETVLMNGLTVNLHLLMASFYRPSGRRTRIVVEANAFPSDLYAVATHAAHHGLDPDDAVLRLEPRPGEPNLRTEDIMETITREGPSIALLLLGGVNYLTGELLDMREITAAGRRAGALVGWDLAHAVGNVPLALHDWDVDFAAWCTYKYLNAGPGAIAGAFVHERHGTDVARLAGWWGCDPARRFEMAPTFTPAAHAEGWQISNPPILAMAPLVASLRLFDEVGIQRLRARSLRMTGYLERLLTQVAQRRDLAVTTPADPARRGCQLSLDIPDRARGIYEALKSRGVVCDFREPSTLRVAPVPLYNTYEDVRRFAIELDRCLGAV